jgi:hypothetical protein
MEVRKVKVRMLIATEFEFEDADTLEKVAENYRRALEEFCRIHNWEYGKMVPLHIYFVDFPSVVKAMFGRGGA